MYRVVRFSNLRFPSRESEKLYAVRINYKLLGRDLGNFKRNFKEVGNFLAEPFKADSRAIKDVGLDVVQGAKKAVSGVKEVKIRDLSFKNLKRRVKQDTQRAKDWIRGEDGEVIADHVGANADKIKSLKGKFIGGGGRTKLLAGYLNPAAMSKRYTLQLAKKLKVKDPASLTTPYALFKKRVRQASSLLRPNGKLRQGATDIANRVAMNPGGQASREVNKVISSGGDEVLNHMVNLNKLEVHARAASGGVGAMAQVGLGMYPADYLRTAIRTGAAAGDKLANRYVSTLRNGKWKPVRLGARYRLGSIKAGKLYKNYLHKPVEKLVNTGVAMGGMATGNPQIYENMLTTGAPLITGNTFRTLKGTVSKKAGSVINNINNSVQHGLRGLSFPKVPQLRLKPAT